MMLAAALALSGPVSAQQDQSGDGSGAVERAFAPPPRPEALAPDASPPAPQSPSAEAPPSTQAPEGQSARLPPARAVSLRALDKFSGLATPLGADLGASIDYQRLSILVRRCERGPQGDAAYLVITDAKAPQTPVFEGWMFAESPALSALDHPRYDVWLASCNTRSGDGG